jgi:hypothetical protein
MVRDNDHAPEAAETGVRPQWCPLREVIDIRSFGKHKGAIRALLLAVAAGAAAFAWVINLDEGRKMHIKKQLNEVAEMPGRLLT